MFNAYFNEKFSKISFLSLGYRESRKQFEPLISTWIQSNCGQLSENTKARQEKVEKVELVQLDSNPRPDEL